MRTQNFKSYYNFQIVKPNGMRQSKKRMAHSKEQALVQSCNPNNSRQYFLCHDY